MLSDRVRRGGRRNWRVACCNTRTHPPDRPDAPLPGSGVHSALCMVLFVCCRRQPERLLALCSGPGGELVAHLLASSEETLSKAAHEPQSSSAAEWLLFLLGEVCACGSRFMLLYAALGNERAGATVEVCSASSSGQALLLHAAAGAAEMRETASASADEQPEARLRWFVCFRVVADATCTSDLRAPAARACFLFASCRHRARRRIVRPLRSRGRRNHDPCRWAALVAQRSCRRCTSERQLIRCGSGSPLTSMRFVPVRV